MILEVAKQYMNKKHIHIECTLLLDNLKFLKNKKGCLGQVRTGTLLKTLCYVEIHLQLCPNCLGPGAIYITNTSAIGHITKKMRRIEWKRLLTTFFFSCRRFTSPDMSEP